MESVKEELSDDKPWQPIGTSVPNLEVKKLQTNGRYRVVYHAHPTNTIALTFVLPLEDKIFTSELMKKYDVAIWAYHGKFCSGEDFDLTFGLMHTCRPSRPRTSVTWRWILR